MTENEMFRVTLTEASEGSSNIVYSWEVPKETCDRLIAANVVKPKLLAMAAKVTYTRAEADQPPKEERFLEAWAYTSLHKNLGHLQVSQPGDYTVYFLIVWSNYGALGELGEYSASRHELSDYFREVTGRRVLTSRPRLEQVSKVSFHVSPDQFAIEPSKFGWWWANFWFGTTPKDRCAYRQRLWLITVPQTVYLLGFISVRTICGLLFALMLTLLANRPRLSPIWHPFSQSLWRASCESFKFEWSFRHLVRLPFTWLSLGAIVYGLALIPLELILSTFFSIAFAALVCALASHLIGRWSTSSPSNNLQRYYAKIPKGPSPLAVWYAAHKQRKCLPYKDSL